MGQQWHVLNVDRKGRQLVNRTQLEDIFREEMSELYKWLRIPCLPKAVDQWLSRGKFVVDLRPIGRLPVEALDMIFTAILGDDLEYRGHNFINCLHLSVTCKQFLSVGKRHVIRALAALQAPAVDCRLICLGEHAGADDQAPPGMLTDTELKDIATPDKEDRKFHGDDGGDAEDKPAEVAAPPCLYSFASAKYRDCDAVLWTVQKPLRQLCRDMHKRRQREGPYIDARLLFDMHMVTRLGCAEYFPRPAYPDGPNALCNMSKGEYVLEDTLVALETQRGPINLAHALLSRICYSPDSDSDSDSDSSSTSVARDSDEYAQQLAKGPWAGDRFRITPANQLPVLTDGKEWKDVTEEANKLLCYLWSVYDIVGVEDDADSGVQAGEEEAE